MQEMFINHIFVYGACVDLLKLKWDYYTNEKLWYYSYEEQSLEVGTAFYILANQKTKGKLPHIQLLLC